MKFEHIIDTCLLTVGSAYSLANIEQVLGVIILFIQLLWIIAKLWLKIYRNIRSRKDIDTIPNDIENTIDEIVDIKDALNSKVGEFDERGK